jgi:hypothetical protein
MDSVTVSPSAQKTYDGKVFSDVPSLAYAPNTVDTSLILNKSSVVFNSDFTTATQAGTYPISITSNDLYSTQFGYILGFGTGALQIGKAPLTITGASAANKTYDGTTAANVSGASLAGVFNNDDVTLTLGAASFNTKDAGTAKPITVTGSALTGASAGNYLLTELSGLSANITQAPLTITASNVELNLGAALPITYKVTYAGFVNGEDSTVLSGLAVAPSCGACSDAGVFDLVPSGATASNYAITFVNGVLTLDTPTRIITHKLPVVNLGNVRSYDLLGRRVKGLLGN